MHHVFTNKPMKDWILDWVRKLSWYVLVIVIKATELGTAIHYQKEVFREANPISRVPNKKKVVKQVYRVKKDGKKDTSLDLNLVDEMPINVLETSAINDKEKEKSVGDIPSAISEQSKLRELKIKKVVSLSKIEVQTSLITQFIKLAKEKPPMT